MQTLDEVRKSESYMDNTDGIHICPYCKYPLGESSYSCMNCALSEYEVALSNAIQQIEELRTSILHAVATIENEHDPDLVRPWLVGHVLSGLRDALLEVLP